MKEIVKKRFNFRWQVLLKRSSISNDPFVKGVGDHVPQIQVNIAGNVKTLCVGGPTETNE